MPRQAALALCVLFLAPLLWLPAAPPGPKDKKGGMKQVRRDALEVSDGKVGENEDGFLTIDSPEVRAQEKGPPARAARLVFTYNGQPAEVAKLASGDVAHQIGLKLRAMNTCNLLYVMWKLEEKERIAVSVKRNPGQSTHKECGASRYVGIKPLAEPTGGRLPKGKDGKRHVLEAVLSKPSARAYSLVVKADGREVWRGAIDAKLLDDIDGPAGFRTDNGKFTFQFFSEPR